MKSFINWQIVLSALVFAFLVSCSKNEPAEKKYTDNYTFEEPEVTGNTFYIDPVNGSMDGDGSQQNPWKTLQEIFDNNLVQYYKPGESYNPESELVLINGDAPVKGGDRLILKSGYHGYLRLSVLMMKDWLTIETAEDEAPVLSQIMLNGAFKNIFFKGMTIDKSSYQGNENYWEAEAITRNSNACLYLGSSDFWGNGSNVKIKGLTLKTTEDVNSWIAEDWVEKASSGISLRSVEHIEIVNCNIENVQHGISVDYNSDNSQVVGNTVTNFSGDGSRVTSNNVLFAYNTIQGCLKVDDNHDDCLQSYSRGEDNSPGTGIVSNVIIRGNLFISIIDPDNPLAGSAQGIGCFDGMFDNWIVENNVIISNTYHGISFYGFTNSKIVNNTVIDQVPGDDVSPWIMIHDHKDGRESSNCVIANNIVSSSVSADGNNIEVSCNHVFGKSNYDSIYTMFVSPDNLDFHLLNNDYTRRTVIDLGEIFSNLVSSEVDRDKNKRDEFPDLGAYEFLK